MFKSAHPCRFIHVVVEAGLHFFLVANGHVKVRAVVDQQVDGRICARVLRRIAACIGYCGAATFVASCLVLARCRVPHSK
jgi:hypothetical protein